MNDRVELARMAFLQLNKGERRAFLATFTEATPTTTTEAAPARIIRRMEVARRLGRSPRAVDRLAAEGALRKVLLPGRTRAAGFRESDVAALIAWGTP
jgi:hypothetical protein